MNCYACDKEAVRRCSRCDNTYCADHGSTEADAGPPLCAECLDPARATPSTNLFRGAVLVLLIASVFALWLIVRPPDLPGEDSSAVGPIETADPTTPGGPTVTIPPSSTPGPSGEATPSPSGEATPVPTAAATPVPGETPVPTEPPAQTTYVVVEGDTWFGVAAQFGVDPEALAAANGRTIDDFLVIGETLIIP